MKNLVKYSIGALALAVSLAANAIPTLQVGAPGSGLPGDMYATYATVGSDEDTAFTTGFTLYVAGAYGQNPSKTDLLIGGKYTSSSGNGLDWGGVDSALAAFNTHGAVLVASVANGVVPTTLTVNGASAFLTSATSMFPNNHYPAQDNVSDFLYFDIGNFAKNPSAVPNFADETGSAIGEVKSLTLNIVGVDWVHFDVMALVTDNKECKGNNCTYVYMTDVANNPSSHDVTWNKPNGGGGGGNIPEPGSLALLGLGLLGLAAARRKSAAV